MLSTFWGRFSNRSHFRACRVLPSLPTGPRWCNVRAADTDRCNLPYSSLQLIARAGRDGAQLTGIAMRNRKRSRRDVLKTSTAFAAGVLFAEPVRAAAPPRAQSECRPPVPEFLLQRGGKTIVGRQFRSPSFHAQIKEKPGHPPLSALKLLKSDPDGAAGAERGNQGALRQNIQGVIDSEGGALRSVCPEYFA